MGVTIQEEKPQDDCIVTDSQLCRVESEFYNRHTSILC